VRIEVQDTGIGISADHIPYIYDEFFQITGGANTPRDGYGLGLSIVTRLVKLLNLKLEVHSQPGKGSSFSLELPSSAARARIPARPWIADAAPERPEAAHRVLLVEDDAGVRNATRFLLEGEGYEVFTAASYTEALQKADDLPGLDLLISDYHLDGAQTGIEVIASLRDKLGAHLKAVLVTGDTSPTIKGLHLDERLRMISKPVQAEQLLELLAQLLRRT
jgi:CheY-like chemotaxis protein